MAFPKSVLIFSTIAKGVAIGAQNPTHKLISKLAKPCSAIVGTSLSMSARVLLVTPKAFNLLDLI